MKVKIFRTSSHGTTTIQDEINTYIKENKLNYDECFFLQSQSKNDITITLIIKGN